MTTLKKGKPRENNKLDVLRAELSTGSRFVKFSMNIPRSLHKDFRKKCFLEEKDMKDVLLEAIDNYMKS